MSAKFEAVAQKCTIISLSNSATWIKETMKFHDRYTHFADNMRVFTSNISLKIVDLVNNVKIHNLS